MFLLSFGLPGLLLGAASCGLANLTDFLIKIVIFLIIYLSNKQESSLPLLQTRLGRLASGLTERLRRFSRLPQAASFALTFPVIVFFCIRS